MATPAELSGLKAAAQARGIAFETLKGDEPLGNYLWFGQVGNELVIASGPVREGGHVVMGSIGWLGTAARGMRLQALTEAASIVQLGMAFGSDPKNQNLGDVLVSSSLVAYDNRIVRDSQDGSGGYRIDYSGAKSYPAQPALVNLFRAELDREDPERANRTYKIHIGAMLSGAARIQSQRFRDELIAGVPAGDAPIVGGEMEGIGLLAASITAKRPIWCVVKGISDFADENRDLVIDQWREIACRNAADFVLAALQNGPSHPQKR